MIDRTDREYHTNVTYTQTRSFRSEIGIEDLEAQINHYCNGGDIKVDGISHNAVEIQGLTGLRPTPNSAPIYNRVVLYTAIIYYTNRK
jgi:hypothetical protein